VEQKSLKPAKTRQPEARALVVTLAIQALQHLEMFFSRAEFDFSIVSSEPGALQALKSTSRPSVVLIDCSAPMAAEGRALARRISTTQWVATTRIIGLISQTDLMPIEDNSMWGFDDVIIKPLLHDEIMPQIEANLLQISTA